MKDVTAAIEGGLLGEDRDQKELKPKDALERLLHAGDERSRMWEKLREAVHAIAAAFLRVFYRDNVSTGGIEIEVRGKAKFFFNSLRMWSFSWPMRPEMSRSFWLSVSQDTSEPRNLLQFAEAVRGGLLDQFAEKLETEAREATEAVGTLESALDKLERFVPPKDDDKAGSDKSDKASDESSLMNFQFRLVQIIVRFSTNKIVTREGNLLARFFHEWRDDQETVALVLTLLKCFDASSEEVTDYDKLRANYLAGLKWLRIQAERPL